MFLIQFVCYVCRPQITWFVVFVLRVVKNCKLVDTIVKFLVSTKNDKFTFYLSFELKTEDLFKK